MLWRHFTILNLQWLHDNRSDRSSLTCCPAISSTHYRKALEHFDILHIRVCDNLLHDFAIFVVEDPDQPCFVARGFNCNFAKTTKTCCYLVVEHFCSNSTCLETSLQWQPGNNCNKKILSFFDRSRIHDRWHINRKNYFFNCSFKKLQLSLKKQTLCMFTTWLIFGSLITSFWSQIHLETKQKVVFSLITIPIFVIHKVKTICWDWGLCNRRRCLKCHTFIFLKLCKLLSRPDVSVF